MVFQICVTSGSKCSPSKRGANDGHLDEFPKATGSPNLSSLRLKMLPHIQKLLLYYSVPAHSNMLVSKLEK